MTQSKRKKLQQRLRKFLLAQRKNSSYEAAAYPTVRATLEMLEQLTDLLPGKSKAPPQQAARKAAVAITETIDELKALLRHAEEWEQENKYGKPYRLSIHKDN